MTIKLTVRMSISGKFPTQSKSPMENAIHFARLIELNLHTLMAMHGAFSLYTNEYA